MHVLSNRRHMPRMVRLMIGWEAGRVVQEKDHPTSMHDTHQSNEWGQTRSLITGCLYPVIG